MCSSVELLMFPRVRDPATRLVGAFGKVEGGAYGIDHPRSAGMDAQPPMEARSPMRDQARRRPRFRGGRDRSGPRPRAPSRSRGPRLPVPSPRTRDDVRRGAEQPPAASFEPDRRRPSTGTSAKSMFEMRRPCRPVKWTVALHRHHQHDMGRILEGDARAKAGVHRRMAPHEGRSSDGRTREDRAVERSRDRPPRPEAGTAAVNADRLDRGSRGRRVAVRPRSRGPRPPGGRRPFAPQPGRRARTLHPGLRSRRSGRAVGLDHRRMASVDARSLVQSTQHRRGTSAEM